MQSHPWVVKGTITPLDSQRCDSPLVGKGMFGPLEGKGGSSFLMVQSTVVDLEGQRCNDTFGWSKVQGITFLSAFLILLYFNQYKTFLKKCNSIRRKVI